MRCPRCGYDQRGEMAKWADSCPLTSVCTECGLEIDWAELISPKFERPAWCVEPDIDTLNGQHQELENKLYDIIEKLSKQYHHLYEGL